MLPPQCNYNDFIILKTFLHILIARMILWGYNILYKISNDRVSLMIETVRCILRSFEEKDLDSFMIYRNNNEWMKYQGFKNLTKDEYRKALLVPPNIENGVQLAIADKNTDELLGDLYLIKKENTIEIGYTINPAYARKGYMTEILEAVLIKLKECYPGYKIIAEIEKDNIPSRKLLLKLGFVYDDWIEEWKSEVYIYL